MIDLLRHVVDKYTLDLSEEDIDKIHEYMNEVVRGQSSEVSSSVAENAWREYTAYDTPEYAKGNAERWKVRELLVNRYGQDGDVTVIGTINQNDDGSHTLEHDYSPDSETIREIEKCLQDYFKQTPPEEQAVIVEGGFENIQFASRSGGARGC